MIIYSTLVAMAAVGTSPMPVFFALIIFNSPEVVLFIVVPAVYYVRSYAVFARGAHRASVTPNE